MTRKGESERSVLYPKDSQIIQESWHMYPSPLSSHLKVIEHPGDLQDVWSESYVWGMQDAVVTNPGGGGGLKEFLGGDVLLIPWNPLSILDLVQLNFATLY